MSDQSENIELLRRLDAWRPSDNAGPLIRWAAGHLRGCISITCSSWAQATKLIREAHRYCTVKEHGGHDFDDCPMWRAFLARNEGDFYQRTGSYAPIALTPEDVAAAAVEPR